MKERGILLKLTPQPLGDLLRMFHPGDGRFFELILHSDTFYPYHLDVLPHVLDKAF